MFDVMIITRRGEAQCVQAFHAEWQQGVSLSESGNVLELMWQPPDGAQMLSQTDRRNAACTRQNSRRGNDLINDYPEGMRAVQDRSITHHSKAGGRHRKRRNVEATEENSRKTPERRKGKV